MFEIVIFLLSTYNLLVQSVILSLIAYWLVLFRPKTVRNFMEPINLAFNPKLSIFKQPIKLNE
jgi:hypothetical protein